MPTTAEIIAAQKYYYDLSVSVAGKRLGPERDQWIASQTARNAYVATLTPEEQKVFSNANISMNAAVQDQIDREQATRERERLQSFTKTAATFVAVGTALPIVFGPATGGLYAPGNLLGPTVAAEFVGPPESIAGVGQAASFVGPPTSIPGVGGVGIGGAGDVAAAAMENQVIPSGGILGTIGGVGKVIGGGLDTLATVIPKVGGIINTIEGVLGREDQPTVDIRDNPAGDLPTNSAPVINLTIPAQSTGGIVLTPPAAEQPNTMLYIGLGILAIILLKGL